MSDFRATSPTSDVFSDEVDSLSTRENALLKKTASKNINNNLKAGYVPVDVQNFKGGMKGRKTFAFWTLVVLLFILAVGNLVLTITILGVLRLGQGMQSIEFLPQQTIKFFGDTDLGHLYKRDGILEGFRNEPINIVAEESSVVVNLLNKTGRANTKLTVNNNGTIMSFTDAFIVKNRNKDTVFSTTSPHFHSLQATRSLNSNTVETNRITSPIDHKLKIESRSNVNLKGAEGTKMESHEIIWNVDQEMYLKSINGSIVLSGNEGTFIDVNRIPIAMLKTSNQINYQYKLCVCMPQGKLFKIPVYSGSSTRVYCHHINMSTQYNPCI